MLAQVDTKTVYSFMDSLVTIEQYVARAKELGYTHLGIMDRDNLYAAYSFMEACWRAGIHPIVGCEMEWQFDEETVLVKLLALNTIGYRHLMKLSTAQMTGRRDSAVLREHLAGILVIVPVSQLDVMERVAGDMDFHVGIYPDTPVRDFGRKLFPLHTVRYFEDNQREVLQVLQAIRENCPLHEVELPARHQDLLPPQSLQALFSDTHPDSLSEAKELLQSVHYEVDKSLKLPRFNRSRSAQEELAERVAAGLSAKGLMGENYQQRMAEELSVIHEMGFDDYFLIVWDLLRFGRSQGYYMGMGRGSAVGSLVAYALDITGIDPVRHHLLFERFLNRERYSMPDIDIDIPDVYRPEFIRYVRNRYGSLHSAQIVTYSTFGAKQAIRDVFKRFGTPEYELTAITKKISFRDSLSSAYEGNAAFRQLIHSRPEYQKAFAIAKQIEGQPRQTSIHAAGVVMSDEDLTDTIPLKQGEDMLLTQYDAHAVEANGLLKMDFLGLRNLTFVQRMKEKWEQEMQQPFSIEGIDLEDEKTIALFAAGQTKGIFQFEQAGAISLLKRVQPTSFEDIVATTSLNRPGASDYADNFVRRKHGRERVDLLDESIATILAPTYGIMLYQEQVMQIAQVYAGFTLGKADLLRRAMSKKNPQEMQKMEADFLKGSVQKGHDEAKAKQLFSMMAKFAGYGFNRSHAYAYSALAFQLAYFKAHHPAIFFDVMLNYSSSDYLTDALQYGFSVLAFDINRVSYQDKIAGQQIALGLKHVKGLPRDLAYWLMENRPFKNIEDILVKLPVQYRKKDTLLPLIQLGLLDRFEPNRRKIVENLDNLFVFAETFGSFFADEDYSWTEVEDYSASEKFELEQAIVGVGISPHPLLSISKKARLPFQALADLVEGEQGRILVQITSIRQIRTKKTGQQMAFLQVTDGLKKMDVTVFPETYHRLSPQLSVGGIWYMTGKINARDGHLQLVLESLEAVEQVKCWLLLENHTHDQEIAGVLAEFSGDIPVVLHYQETNETLQLEGYLVEKSDALVEKLATYSMKTIFR